MPPLLHTMQELAVQFGREGWDVSEEVYEGNNKRE